MTRINSQRIRSVGPLGLLMVLGALAISTASGSQRRVLEIASPRVLAAEPGQTVSITVHVLSGEFSGGIGLLSPVGTAGPVPVSHSSAMLSMTLPNTLALGLYPVTAVASDSKGALQTSEPITIDVERTDTPKRLDIDPLQGSVVVVGASVPLTIFASFSDNAQLDVTRSTRLKVTSANIHIATVQDGILTAVSPGQTTVDVQFGLLTQQVGITVAAAH